MLGSVCTARDLAELNGLDFPVFAQGLSVHGNKGKGVRVSVGQPITLDSVGVCQVRVLSEPKSSIFNSIPIHHRSRFDCCC